MNVTCLKHPNYRAQKTPELACKICCATFMEEVRKKKKSGIYFDYQAWRGDRRKMPPTSSPRGKTV